MLGPCLKSMLCGGTSGRQVGRMWVMRDGCVRVLLQGGCLWDFDLSESVDLFALILELSG